MQCERLLLSWTTAWWEQFTLPYLCPVTAPGGPRGWKTSVLLVSYENLTVVRTFC